MRLVPFYPLPHPPCEVTARKQQSMNQEMVSHQTLNVPVPGSRIIRNFCLQVIQSVVVLQQPKQIKTLPKSKTSFPCAKNSCLSKYHMICTF